MSSPQFQKAFDERFARSTREEMFTFFDELGFDRPHHKSGDDLIRKKLLEACNILDESKPVSQPTVMRSSTVLPKRNLIFERGPWQGRCHRVKLRRPDGVSSNDGGRAFSVQGVSYTLPYEAVKIVPEPILEVMRNAVKARPHLRRVVGEDGFPEVQTDVLIDQSIGFDYLGVDEATKDEPGGLQEFYNSTKFNPKGKDLFLEMTPEQVREVCHYIGMPIRGKNDLPIDIEVLRDRLVEMFFPLSFGVAA